MASRASDNFNRANGAIGSNWSTWTNGGGAPAIVGNAVKCSTTSNPDSGGAIWTADTFVADQFSEISVPASITNGDWIAVVVRGDTAGNNNYTAIYFNNGGTYTLWIYKKVANAYTGLGSSLALPGALSAGDVYRLEASGTTIRCLVNGVQKISLTDSTFSTGQPGIAAFGPDLMDNWAGGNLDPFPTTSVIDTFNRANESPLATASSGATWADLSGFYAAGGLKVVTNQAQSTTAGSRRGMYISSANYGPDTEAYVTVVNAPGADTETVDLWVRLTNPTTTPTGYFLRWGYQSSAADTWTLIRRDSAANVTLASATQDITAGDKIGIGIVGTVIKCYRFNGTTWVPIITYDTASDATKYSAAGRIALGIQDNTEDDFAGGTVVTGAAGAALVATIAGQSAVTAGLTDRKALAASIAGQSGVVAALRVAKAMQAAIAGGSTVTAAIKVVRTLAAQVPGVSVVSGSLTDKKLMAAAVGGQSQALAALSAGGTTIVVTSRDGQNAVIYIVTNQ